ncbi:hypothetical protein C7M84_020752 [Penaeus vannamei]|uniref:Integrase catalytic domain-containing protein n=1 Tax=Penaeus vannamei TaxID=6689 RepID=A0A423SBD9_PENVA|nr:hypothetical protein C7M84_020752 [Penaeus vannamei]
MSRWSHEIASYDCKIIYKPGAAHHVPDLLSRAVAAIDLSSIDPDQFRMLQLEDPLRCDIIQFVEGKALPRVKIPASLDEFEVNNGVLYHVRKLPSGLVSQLVLPPKVRPAARKILHNSSTAGHPANPLATEPFECDLVDLIELPVTNNGDRYVLTIVDELTRFIQLVPMPTKDAHTVADALISHFITLFGPPVTLSDNGSEFTGEYVREVCELLGTKTRNTIPNNPASNGLVERCNTVIKDCLAALCEDTPNTWNTRLDYVRLALNTAFHRSVNNQPLYLLTGRECTFPVGLTNHHTRDGEIGNRQLDLLAARDAAVTGTQRVREENMEGVDKRKKAIPELREGTLILRKRPPGVQPEENVERPDDIDPDDLINVMLLGLVRSSDTCAPKSTSPVPPESSYGLVCPCPAPQHPVPSTPVKDRQSSPIAAGSFVLARARAYHLYPRQPQECCGLPGRRSVWEGAVVVNMPFVGPTPTPFRPGHSLCKNSDAGSTVKDSTHYGPDDRVTSSPVCMTRRTTTVVVCLYEPAVTSSGNGVYKGAVCPPPGRRGNPQGCWNRAENSDAGSTVKDSTHYGPDDRVTSSPVCMTRRTTTVVVCLYEPAVTSSGNGVYKGAVCPPPGRRGNPQGCWNRAERRHLAAAGDRGPWDSFAADSLIRSCIPVRVRTFPCAPTKASASPRVQ